MPLSTPDDLFVHQLASIYAMEHAVAKMLPMLAGEVQDELLKDRLQHHETETAEQIKNLKKVFSSLHVDPPSIKNPVAEGLAAAHKSFKAMDPSRTVLEMFDLGAASKAEALEIAAYHGLITRARQKNQMEIAHLLQQNLKQEKEMLHALQQLAHTLGSAAVRKAA